MKARRDPCFPSDKPFRRFRTKSNLIRELAMFADGQTGYEKVASLCKEYLSNNGSVGVEEPLENASAKATIGFVYLIKSGRYYKIGHSNAAGRREYELAIQLPEKLTTVHVIRTDDPVGIEAYWHNRFKEKRKNGEWFELTAADVAAFKRRKFM